MSVADDWVNACLPWITPDMEDLLRSIGEMWAPTELLVETRPDGTPGWAPIWDIDLCPGPDDLVNGLPWLAQFVGERLPVGLTDAASRQWIKDAPNQRRGTAEAIARAGQRHLTGSKTLMMKERSKADGTPHEDYLTVMTMPNETIDLNITIQDLLSQMPADIELSYRASSIVLWSDVAEYGLWSDVLDANATWTDVAAADITTIGGWRVWTV